MGGVAAAPFSSATNKPTPVGKPVKALPLMRGQAPAPQLGTPLNPWGLNRGGSGLMPIYRRPGTLP